jgi:hypothetical protein
MLRKGRQVEQFGVKVYQFVAENVGTKKSILKKVKSNFLALNAQKITTFSQQRSIPLSVKNFCNFFDTFCKKRILSK